MVSPSWLNISDLPWTFQVMASGGII